MAAILLRPLTVRWKMQKRTDDGGSMRKLAADFIKPNNRLTPFERVEIYNRCYWFRILDCFYDDYPGLLAVLGNRKFLKLATAYLERYPTLTNSSKAGVTAQMKNSGLGEFFAEFLTVEEIGIYKPATHVYRWAARRAGAKTQNCMLIAAHGWDVAGALWADMRAAFLARPGQHLYPPAPEPEIIARDLAKPQKS